MFGGYSWCYSCFFCKRTNTCPRSSPTDNRWQRKDELNTPAKGCLPLPGSGSVFGGWIFLHRLGGCFGVGLFSYEVVADHLHDDGDDPGARVRNKEDVEGSVIRENSEDPQDSGAYGSDYGEDHGDGGGAHASQGAGEEIHDSAEEGAVQSLLFTVLAVSEESIESVDSGAVVDSEVFLSFDTELFAVSSCGRLTAEVFVLSVSDT